MKTSKMATVAGLFVGLAVVATLLCVSDAHAAVAATKATAFHYSDLGFYAAQLVLATGIDNLRAQHTQLTRSAEQIRAGITEGMTPEQIAEIERKHTAALADVRAVADAIAAEQTRLTQNPPTPAPAPAVTPEEATRAERARLADLTGIATRANIDGNVLQAAISAGTTSAVFREMADIATRSGLDAAALQTAISTSMAVDGFRAQAFDAMASRSNATRTNGSHTQMGREEQETRRAGMTAAIVARLTRATALTSAARDAVVIPEHARAYGEMGFAEMAAECIGYRGHLRTPRQVAEVIERAMHSTSDFPAIFAGAISQRLLARYQAATPTYRLIAARYLAADFRFNNLVRAGDFPQLQPVTETGEIKSGSFSESKEGIRVYPYGVQFNLSRQMIINDQLGALDQMLGSYGDRVTDWENAKVMALLVSNPAMLTDNVAMFHASHGNLGSASAVNVAGVGAGRAAMAKQKSLDNILLNLQPSVILSGPDKQTEAEQLVTSITPAAIASTVPEGIRRIKPVSDGNLTGNAWYLFADPNVAPAIMYALLEGYEGPRLKTEDKFGSQGMAVSLEHDFGVGAVDYRGAHKNPGA